MSFLLLLILRLALMPMPLLGQHGELHDTVHHFAPAAMAPAMARRLSPADTLPPLSLMFASLPLITLTLLMPLLMLLLLYAAFSLPPDACRCRAMLSCYARYAIYAMPP